MLNLSSHPTQEDVSHVMASRRLEFDDCALAGELFGPHNAHLKRLSKLSGVSAESRGSSLVLSAEGQEPVDAAANLLTQLYGLIRSGRPLSPQDIDHGWRVVASDPSASLDDLFQGQAISVSRRRTVSPRSLGQRRYLEAIQAHDMTFGVGPAGTGKTYLAVAMAIAAISTRSVKRLVLTRPAVEAGEKLGFLPGDLTQKVDPYLRPLYDALGDMLELAKVQDMLETGIIEVAPLAFMRGRTLNDAFIILDEAQNTTPEQMKMFLTRLGFGSKAVVTGDVTQVDLPGRITSGLTHALRVLREVPGVAITHLDKTDVVRHPLVGRIVNAYEQEDEKSA